MLMGHEVRLRLEGPEGEIEIDALLEGARGLVALLRRPGSRVRWVVSDMKLGSLDLAVRPEGILEAEDLQQVDDLDATLTALSVPEAVPTGWPRDRTMSLLSIARLTGTSHVTDAIVSIDGRDHIVGHQVEKNLEKSLAEMEDRPALGSIRGTLMRYHGRKREVGIVDSQTGQSVTAYFPAALTERIARTVEKEIMAWGELTRDRAGRPIRLRIRDIEVVDAALPPVPVERMIGIWGSDWTDGLSSEEWVRRQRER